jgi:hypothetical protein
LGFLRQRRYLPVFSPSPVQPHHSRRNSNFLMVTLDPRFGSISFVAIISALTGRSGMFSYNLSCALVMVTASVGLAGIFSRSLIGFVIMSSWRSIARARPVRALASITGSALLLRAGLHGLSHRPVVSRLALMLTRSCAVRLTFALRTPHYELQCDWLEHRDHHEEGSAWTSTRPGKALSRSAGGRSCGAARAARC